MDIVQRLRNVAFGCIIFLFWHGFAISAACQGGYIGGARIVGQSPLPPVYIGHVGTVDDLTAQCVRLLGDGYQVAGGWVTTSRYLQGECGRWFNGSWQHRADALVTAGTVIEWIKDGQVYPSDPGTCQANPDQVCASLGDLGSSSSKWVYKGDALSTCRGDCVFIPESSGYDKVSGYTIAWGKLINQGVSCGNTTDVEPTGFGENDPDKPTDAPHAGEKGYCPGTYNGATIWVKCSSTNETTKTDNTTTKTETNGGSSTTGTTTTSTTSKTSCDGSNCTTTTTTTTTNPDGTKTDKSETTSQAQADYCTRNPNATACKRPEGSFGGSCTAGFSCEGDAVQCAIAREAYRRNCELLEKETPESTLGKSIANGEDRPVGHPGNSPEIVNVSGNINQTNPYGGSCPPDINLNVYGKTVIVPLSNACDIFKWMGYIAVAFTMYAAARITMSGIST